MSLNKSKGKRANFEWAKLVNRKPLKPSADEAVDGDGEEEKEEPDTEGGDEEGSEKSKRAKRTEDAQEKMVKLGDASVRLPYEFNQELQPLHTGRLWKMIPELTTSQQMEVVKDVSKPKNKKDIDLTTETTEIQRTSGCELNPASAQKQVLGMVLKHSPRRCHSRGPKGPL